MLNDTILELLEPIIGSPSNDYEALALYVVSCFIFIVIVKLLYDLLGYLTGLNR